MKNKLESAICKVQAVGCKIKDKFLYHLILREITAKA